MDLDDLQEVVFVHMQSRADATRDTAAATRAWGMFESNKVHPSGGASAAVNMDAKRKSLLRVTARRRITLTVEFFVTGRKCGFRLERDISRVYVTENGKRVAIVSTRPPTFTEQQQLSQATHKGKRTMEWPVRPGSAPPGFDAQAATWVITGARDSSMSDPLVALEMLHDLKPELFSTTLAVGVKLVSRDAAAAEVAVAVGRKYPDAARVREPEGRVEVSTRKSKRAGPACVAPNSKLI